jgi:hypothetical protein
MKRHINDALTITGRCRFSPFVHRMWPRPSTVEWWATRV